MFLTPCKLMNNELEEKLYQRFPTFFADRTKPLAESLMAFGCDCGDGWFQILWDMCEKLEAVDPQKALRFMQIKEKWGTLRVYAHGDGNDGANAIIEEAEKRSAVTCESCGAVNETVETKGRGYIHTLCKNCREGGPKNPIGPQRRDSADIKAIIASVAKDN